MQENPLVRRCGEMMEAEVDGELVALHVDKGTCFGFNSTATRVWSLLEQPRRFSELAEELVEEYDVDRDTCERQLRELLDQLGEEGLVVVE